MWDSGAALTGGFMRQEPREVYDKGRSYLQVWL